MMEYDETNKERDTVDGTEALESDVEEGTEECVEENVAETQSTDTVEEVSVEKLMQQLEACREQSEYHLDQWRRTAAEFANYKKRNEREQAEYAKYSNAALIKRLLPVLDDMDRAFANLPEGLDKEPWVEGMALVYRKLRMVFEQEGLREIEAVGQPFDPTLHEAVTHEPSDTAAEGEVIDEVQKGYMLNDRVLRPAMVRVSAGSK